MNAAVAVATPPQALDAPRFERAFVLGAPALGLAVGLAASLVSGAWPWLLGLDLWLLSFPHVASTFTRTAFRREDAREHRWLLLALPLMALGGSAALAFAGGLRALNTVYFFWQTFHYARQSRGIFRALRRAAGRSPDDALSDAVLYLSALWGIAHRCAQGPRVFFGAPLWTPPVPRGVEVALTLAAFAALASWVLRVVREVVSRGSEDVGSRLHVLGHVVLFVAGYVAIDDPMHGWIAVNVWHNAQYLLFVWAWNRRRFAGSPAAERGALAWLSQEHRGAAFFATCAVLGAAGYLALFAVADAGARLAPAFPLYLVLVHAVNFHHYVADAVLWRAPGRRAQGGASFNAPRSPCRSGPRRSG